MTVDAAALAATVREYVEAGGDFRYEPVGIAGEEALDALVALVVAERRSREQAEQAEQEIAEAVRLRERPRLEWQELVLATEARAARLQRELDEALAEVGLPPDAGITGLIRHHRANAGMAASFEPVARVARLEAGLRECQDYLKYETSEWALSLQTRLREVLAADGGAE